MARKEDYTSPHDEIHQKLMALWDDVHNNWVWVDRDKWGDVNPQDVKEEVHNAEPAKREELIFEAFLNELAVLAAARFSGELDDPKVNRLVCRTLRIPSEGLYPTQADIDDVNPAAMGCEGQA